MAANSFGRATGRRCPTGRLRLAIPISGRGAARRAVSAGECGRVRRAALRARGSAAGGQRERNGGEGQRR